MGVQYRSMTVPQTQSLLLQLLDTANRADPYPLYARFRDHGPIAARDINLAVLSSFDDCDHVLRHPLAATDRLKSTTAQREVAAGGDTRPFGPPGFLFLDPPDHTRLRSLVSKAFAPKVVRDLEAPIAAQVASMLDAIAAKGEFDVIEDLARPLPVAVICRLLGVPLEDEEQFGQASAVLAEGLDPFMTFTGQEPEDYNTRLQAGLWLRDYLRGLVAARRSDPRDDLMSALVAVEESGDQLTEEEIIATCNLLLIAGQETTVNLIANAVLALQRHPGQWGALAADPQRVSRVVEETMRYDPPVHLMVRIAAGDLQVGALDVPKGDIIVLLAAAAQRDATVCERPDEFDPDRETIRHLGFGKGIHFCLGAPLARLESAAVLSAVTARFPDLRLTAEPTYKPNLTLRGMSHLPATV